MAIKILSDKINRNRRQEQIAVASCLSEYFRQRWPNLTAKKQSLSCKDYLYVTFSQIATLSEVSFQHSTDIFHVPASKGAEPRCLVEHQPRCLVEHQPWCLVEHRPRCLVEHHGLPVNTSGRGQTLPHSQFSILTSPTGGCVGVRI